VIILGVDPGAGTTGYGVVSRAPNGTVSLVECGVIRTDASTPLPRRLKEIFDGITDVLSRHSAAVVAVEGVFYSKNVRTTVVLGHARGVILLAAELASVPVNEMAPAEIKKAVVGTGGATKEQVQFMLTRLLRLKSVPQPSDAADGVAAALACVMGASLPRIDDGGRVREPSRPRLAASRLSPPLSTRRP
jgi:crossover junction endodeoxyribonuclease RuvC